VTGRRSAGRRARAIASKLQLRGAQQRDQAQAVVRRITGELADIAEQTMRDVMAVIRNARRALRTATGPRRGRLAQAINQPRHDRAAHPTGGGTVPRSTGRGDA